MRMRTPVATFIIFSFLLSCQEPVEQLPVGILPKDSMVSVLTDIQISEAMIQLQSLGRSDSTKEFAYGLYADVFTKHGVSGSRFIRSFEYYRNQPEEFKAMYDLVIENIDQQKLSQEKSSK